MTPKLSADLHLQGIIPTRDALWIYNSEGRIVANLAAQIKNGEPVF